MAVSTKELFDRVSKNRLMLHAELQRTSVLSDGHFRTLNDRNPLCVVMALTKEGAVIMANETFYLLTGLTSLQVEGMPYIQLVHEGDRKATEYAFEHGLDADYFIFHNRYKCASGKCLPINWINKPWTANNVVYAVGLPEEPETCV